MVIPTLDFWDLVLVYHLMPEIFTYLGFGLVVSSSLNQKFRGVLCAQRNQQSIVYAAPVMSCEGWVHLIDSTLGGTVMESLCFV